MIVAYIRVSTNKQETDNQRFEIERFCEERHMEGVSYVEETISGTKDIATRKLGQVFESLERGDTLIVTEISRISRSLFTVMDTLNHCLKNGITLLTVKERYEFKDDITAPVMAFAFGLAAEIERRMISARTREALARKRAEGVRLGRPPGSRPTYSKLHGKDERILRYMDKGVSYSAMARLLDVNRKTLRTYIDKQELIKEHRWRRFNETGV